MADGFTEDKQAVTTQWESSHWARLQELFHLASEAAQGERTRILTEASSDPELVERVLALVAAAEMPSITPAVQNSDVLPGTHLGPYTLVRHLGSGGAGSVYLAERVLGGAVQHCAVKVLAMHAAGPHFQARFQREQQILASFNHPHITKLLDAGVSETGHPYLAMEYVDGIDLLRFCDERAMPVNDRIHLFLQVCDAVSYAHRNLTVHLDLKPSNILVSGEGELKLLDFGTSKLIDTNSVLTTTVMATPAYASPEQLRNEPVTTACDIYALGAVLFELLVGRRPYPDSSVPAMLANALREGEPLRMSAAVTETAGLVRGTSEARLRQTLAGDLSAIVAYCMRSRPQARYTTVDALAADLRRYLEGHPVSARTQTARYLVSKFVRRNRVAVLSTAFGLILLLAVGTYAYVRQEQALRAGERAERMQNFLYSVFKLANSNYTGKPAATIPEFLELGVRVLPDYIKNPADQRAAQLSLAESMFENGDKQGASKVFFAVSRSAAAAHDANAEAEADAFAGHIAYQLGDAKQGAVLTETALRLSAQRSVQPSVRVRSKVYYAEDRENAGQQSDGNLQLLRDAVAEARAENLPERELAFAMYNLASDLEERGTLDEAEDLIHQSLTIYNSEPYAICDQSQMYADLGFITGARGDQPGSVPLFQKALQGAVSCAGPDNTNTLTIQDYTAGALLQVGQAKQAADMMEDALPRWRKAMASGPDLANALFHATLAYKDSGQLKKAEETGAEMLELEHRTFSSNYHTLGSGEQVMAETLIADGKLKEALPHAEIADSILMNTANTPTFKAQAEKMHQELLQLRQSLSKSLEVQAKMKGRRTDAPLP